MSQPRTTPISAVLKEIGLPPETLFIGYVVHLPNNDEFLAFHHEEEYIEHRAFCKTPDLALVYSDYHEAVKAANGCKQKTLVCILFDTGPVLYVQPI